MDDLIKGSAPAPGKVKGQIRPPWPEKGKPYFWHCTTVSHIQARQSLGAKVAYVMYQVHRYCEDVISCALLPPTDQHTPSTEERGEATNDILDFPSMSIHDLNLESLTRNSRFHNAIVVMVVEDEEATCEQSDHQARINKGDWVALHRLRNVRKLLMTSSSQATNFLVTAKYHGTFSMRPMVFEYAGDVPVGKATSYVTLATASSDVPGLSGCQNGSIVRFLFASERICENGDVVKVSHCEVTNDNLEHFMPVMYPASLRGRFQALSTPGDNQVDVHDLFDTSLPVDVQVTALGSHQGEDLLSQAGTLHVEEVLQETTVVAEKVEMIPGGWEGSGNFVELTVARTSIRIEHQLNLPNYCRVHVFPGYKSLPCVEKLSRHDVTVLQRAALDGRYIDMTTSRQAPVAPPSSPTKILSPRELVKILTSTRLESSRFHSVAETYFRTSAPISYENNLYDAIRRRDDDAHNAASAQDTNRKGDRSPNQTERQEDPASTLLPDGYELHKSFHYVSDVYAVINHPQQYTTVLNNNPVMNEKRGITQNRPVPAPRRFTNPDTVTRRIREDVYAVAKDPMVDHGHSADAIL